MEENYNRAWVTHITILKKKGINKYLEGLYSGKITLIKNESNSFFEKRYLFNRDGDKTKCVDGIKKFFNGSENNIAKINKIELCLYSDYALLLSTYVIKDFSANIEKDISKLKTETWSRNRAGNAPKENEPAIDSVISFLLKQIAGSFSPSCCEKECKLSSENDVTEIEILTPDNYVCKKNPLYADWENNSPVLTDMDSEGSSFMFVMASVPNADGAASVSLDLSPSNKSFLENVEQIASCECHKNFSDKKYRKVLGNNCTFSQPTGQSFVRFGSSKIAESEYEHYVSLFIKTLVQKIDCFLRCNMLEETKTKKVTSVIEDEAQSLLETAKELSRKSTRNITTTPDGVVTTWLSLTDIKGLFSDVNSTCSFLLEYNEKQRKDRTELILSAITALTIISVLNDSFSLLDPKNGIWGKISGYIGIAVVVTVVPWILSVFVKFVITLFKHKKK